MACKCCDIKSASWRHGEFAGQGYRFGYTDVVMFAGEVLCTLGGARNGVADLRPQPLRLAAYVS